MPSGTPRRFGLKTRPVLLTVYLSGFTFCLLAVLSFRLELWQGPFSAVSAAAAVMVFDKFLIELLVTLIVCAGLINGGRLSRAFGYALAIAFIVFHSAQFVSIYWTGNFVPRVGFENINHISFLMTTRKFAALGTVILLCAGLPALVEKFGHDPMPQKALTVMLLCLLTLTVFLSLNRFWLPKTIQDQRTTRLRLNNLPHSSPAAAMLRELADTRAGSTDWAFTKNELQVLASLGFHFDPENFYPLEKPSERETKAAFPQVDGSGGAAPNIIVFFTEGLSARTMSAYRPEFAGLTDNFKNFAEQSMTVENYFNHSAATYRGLHGQLCSLYPRISGKEGWHTNYHDLPKTEYLCLPDVLAGRGYETIFLDPHVKKFAYLDEMMLEFGFGKVWTAQTLSAEFLGGEKPLGKDATFRHEISEALSDNQHFRALVQFLKRREENKSAAPFFLAVYNLGTHAWTNVGRDGIKYKDGKNHVLNAIYNLDAAFGEFWRYYQNSPYARNTVVILTTDHAHFQEKAFIAAVSAAGQTDYQKLFVDRIPLIIHDPLRELPGTFDARNATSIDFTPTLLHYLGITTGKDPFLGHSIFRDTGRDKGVAAIGWDVFLTAGDKIHTLNNSERHRETLTLILKFMKACHQLEIQDRVWEGP